MTFHSLFKKAFLLSVFLVSWSFSTAHAQTVTIDSTIDITIGASTYKLLGGGSASSITTTSTSFTIITGNTGTVTVSQFEGKSLDNSAGVAVVCSGTASRTTVPSNVSVIFTPAGNNTCAVGGTGPSSSGGGGGGGGGSSSSGSTGGIYNAPSVPPTNISAKAPAQIVNEQAFQSKVALLQETHINSEEGHIVLPKGVKVSSSAKGNIVINGMQAATADEAKSLKVPRKEEIVSAVKPDLSVPEVKFGKKIEVLLPVEKKGNFTLYSYDEEGRAKKLQVKVVMKLEDGVKKYYAKTSVTKLSETQTFVLTQKKKK